MRGPVWVVRPAVRRRLRGLAAGGMVRREGRALRVGRRRVVVKWRLEVFAAERQ
jgi:acyl-coenzyme A thioesterase PaaI-like protein